MASAILELTGAVVGILKADSAVTALVGGRVYDHVPAGPDGVTAQFPYVSIGAASETRDDAECVEAVEVFLRLDAWSRAVGYAEVSHIADAVTRALHGTTPELGANALVLLEHRRTDRMRDPDGRTSHAAIEFAAIIEQP